MGPREGVFLKTLRGVACDVGIGLGPAIEKLGGKIEAAWFSFGDYDVVVIVDLPDNVSAAAIAMAFAAGGACKSVQTIPLISPEEATQALRKAKECGYRPVTVKPRAA